MLAKECSKFSKPSFSNTSTMNFQMFNLVLEKAEESEIKLPISTGSSKKKKKKNKRVPENIHFSFTDYAKDFDCVDHNKLWKILKEMEITDHLICLLRNLYADQEPTVTNGHGKPDWFQITKGVHQDCVLSPCLFNWYAEYIMRNTGSCLGSHVHPWWIHVNAWQNQYSIVK